MDTLSILPSAPQSPFDAVRHADGSWIGRELMPLMEYSRWEDFETVIKKARDSLALVQDQEQADYHFGACRSDGGRWGNQQLDDYRLTRFAAYLTAMAGDDTKEAVARARVYFAVKTREAEVAPAASFLPDLTTSTGVLALAEQFVLTARQLVEADERIREMEPKALAHDTFLSAQDGDVLVRQVAKLMDWQEKHLRQFLVEDHLIYHRQATCGQGQWDFYADHRHHFRAVEQMVEHTWGRCAHYTLYVRPAGVALIQKRIAKRQSEMAAAIEGGAR